MRALNDLAVLVGRQFLSPVNYIVAFFIGAMINSAIGVGVFGAWISFVVPIVVQIISKSTVNFSNRNNKLLLQLPAQRIDPAFIMDYEGNILASMGETQNKFKAHQIKSLADLFGEYGATRLISACSDVKNINDYTCEEYSERLKSWYKIRLRKDRNYKCLLVWTKNIDEKKKLRDNLNASRHFGSQLLENIHQLQAKNDGFAQVGEFLLNHGFQGVFIAEQQIGDFFQGKVYKIENRELVISEPIEVSEKSNAPILDSFRERSITYADRNEESDFDGKHPFNKDVVKFLNFPINNFINYHEGRVSLIAFNSAERISDPDIVLVEDLINKVRTLNYLIDMNIDLRKSENQLELKIEEILEKENKLLELNKEMNKFFYKTSHDLKTPVVNIQQLLNLIHLETNSIPTDYSRLLNSELTKMTRMLDMLTLVSSLESVSIVTQRFDINSVIGEILDEFSVDSKTENFDIQICIDIDSYVYGVRRLLKMMIKELLFNAWVFRDEKKPDNHVRISLSEENGKCKIIVRDNGLGMSEAVQMHARDMFYRGSSKSLGSGLGLYSVSKVASHLGGSLTFSSVLGEGTEVCLIIPNQNAESLEEAA